MPDQMVLGGVVRGLKTAGETGACALLQVVRGTQVEGVRDRLQ